MSDFKTKIFSNLELFTPTNKYLSNNWNNVPFDFVNVVLNIIDAKSAGLSFVSFNDFQDVIPNLEEPLTQVNDGDSDERIIKLIKKASLFMAAGKEIDHLHALNDFNRESPIALYDNIKKAALKEVILKYGMQNLSKIRPHNIESSKYVGYNPLSNMGAYSDFISNDYAILRKEQQYEDYFQTLVSGIITGQLSSYRQKQMELISTEYKETNFDIKDYVKVLKNSLVV